MTPTSPWDALLDRLDRAVAHREQVSSDLVDELADLLVEAMREGTADRELDPGDSARWLGSLLRAQRLEQDEHESAPDEALSTLRVIVTRWLHPGRLDRTLATFAVEA